MEACESIVRTPVMQSDLDTHRLSPGEGAAFPSPSPSMARPFGSCADEKQRDMWVTCQDKNQDAHMGSAKNSFMGVIKKYLFIYFPMIVFHSL